MGVVLVTTSSANALPRVVSKRVEVPAHTAVKVKSRSLRGVIDYDTAVTVNGRVARLNSPVSRTRIHFFTGRGVQVREKASRSAVRLKYNVANYSGHAATVRLFIRVESWH